MRTLIYSLAVLFIVASTTFAAPMPVDNVISFNPGALNQNSPNDPTAVFAGPDDQWVTFGNGGTLTLGINGKVFFDGAGPDLAIYELGSVDAFSISLTDINNNTFDLGKFNRNNDTPTSVVTAHPANYWEIDFGLASNILFKSLTITDDGVGPTTGNPGADIDFVGLFNVAPASVANTPTPEPASMALFALCLAPAGVGLMRRRKA